MVNNMGCETEREILVQLDVHRMCGTSRIGVLSVCFEMSFFYVRPRAEVPVAQKPDSEVKAMEAAFNALSGLKPEEKGRELSWLWEKLEIDGALPAVPQPGSSSASPQPAPVANVGVGPRGEAPTAKNFIAQKYPKTNVERVTCLAYYLTHYKGTPQFKTKELRALNTEAAQPKFSNAAVAVMNAAGSKYLSPAGGGKKQITVLGEKLVDTLPGRELVKNLPRRRSGRRGKSGKRKAARD